MKRVLAPLGALALVIGLVAVPAMPASAAPPNATSTCDALAVNLSGYSASVPATDATYRTEYQQYKWVGDDTQSNPAVSTPGIAPGDWVTTGASYNGSDSIGVAIHVSGSGLGALWVFWTSTQVLDQPATSAKTNHYAVNINGSSVDSGDFSTSLDKNYPFVDSTIANSWSVTVTPYDGTTETTTGTSSPCVVPTEFAVAKLATSDATCDRGEVLLYDHAVSKHVEWSGSPEGLEGPNTFVVIATADAGYTFDGLQTTKLLPGDLLGPLTEADGCPPPTQVVTVETEAVTFVKHTCDAIGTVTAPDVEGVRYEADLNGTVVGYVENFPAGIFYATDDGTATGTPFYGTITITAHAKDGYALQEGVTAEWADEFTEPDCTTPVEFPTCTGSTTLPVSTDLNTQGWEELGGEYVDGGLRFNSASDGYVYFELPAPMTLSELAPVAFDATPDYGGVIFYNEDNSVNVHYEPYYSNPLWTTRPGILPAGGGGQGSAMSGDFSDLLSNPTVQYVAFWVNANHDVTLHSLTFGCMTQSFSEAIPVTVITVQPQAPTFSDTCGDGLAYMVPGDTNEYEYIDTVNGNTVTVEVSEKEGYEFAAGLQTSWTYTFTDDPCVVTVEPGTVTFSDHTCSVIGTVMAPDVDGVRYEADIDGTVVGHVENFPAGTFYATDDGTMLGNPFYGTITITAYAKDGSVLADGVTAEWTHTFTKPECDTAVASPGDDTLAYTGVSSDSSATTGIAMLLLLVGGAFLVIAARAPRRRRKVMV